MRTPMRQMLAPVIASSLALLVSGCSSFDREWKATPATVPGPLAGRWEGRWLSDKNGHTGKLLCVLTRESDTNYQAYFKATYWKIFRASYRVNLVGEPIDGGWQFKGEEDLGWLAGGVYRYEGRVMSTNFFSTYECRYDNGTFEMRPAP